MMDIEKIAAQTRQGASELLAQAALQPGDVFVLGCSTSEIHGQQIGKDSSLAIGRTVVKTLCELLAPQKIHLAVQGCEHINRALAIERQVALAHGWEVVKVVPALHAGGAAQVAAFEQFTDPVEIEHITAQAGMDIGDTAIGMHVKFVQVPVRTKIDVIGAAHTTYLRSRPKLIGGQRAQYEWRDQDD